MRAGILASAAVIAIAVAVGGYFAFDAFAPKLTTEVDQPLPQGTVRNSAPPRTAEGGNASSDSPGASPSSRPPGEGNLSTGAGSASMNASGSGEPEPDAPPPPPPSQPSLERLAMAAFRDGDRAHHVSGTVAVYRQGDEHFLRFENYSATSGPDVFFYLTPKERASSVADVEGEGLLVLVPGGAEGGQATLRGNFNVPLPGGFDASRYRGVSVWCDDFNVLFGYAVL